MESTAYEYFEALRKYHKIVNDFISETINQESEKDNNYFNFSQDIERLRKECSNLLEMDQSEILQDDILSCRNPFQLLLYLALNSQWNLLENVGLDILTNEACYPTFQINLKLFSSQEFYETMTDLELNEITRSLKRTLAIYFYIHVSGSCILHMDKIYRDKNYPARITESENQQCLNFYRSLTSNSIVSDAFSMIDSNVSLDDLFIRVCDCSYYAVFPPELYGLTTIGDIVFVNDSFSNCNSLGKAATLIILLHESAHLIYRYRRNQSSYLEITPKSCNQAGTKNKSEMGDFAEKLIFGKRLVKINRFSASFLLNRDNWNLSKECFQEGFKMRYKEGKRQGQTDIKVGKGNSSLSIHIGRCGMALNVCN
ncbi:unnamed protein product [Blepharisma stoltei]|uniref:IrrE N-terminal-like domain-containing protein n=1 Tax=Blepharisma stoltei TaxID=1481888 RepID=A0AAU9K3E2_9CILI|nr:unnamed protein product [Blepharisma stoltei]